ncbi:hypothetical protein TNCV_4778611 [Trichonephila clavipes]|nr:hypothetical protein TNCV_4778611 [Trichonephila clavipes]
MANNQSVKRHLDAFTRRIQNSVTSVAAEFELLTASFHDFGDNFKLQEQLSGGSVVVVHEEPHPQMTGTLSYRPEETGGRQREKIHTTQATGRPISRFTVARRLHGGGLFARRPCTVCTFNPCPSEKAFSVVPGTPELRDNEWGRVLFTDESRFSLSSDSHRILIWREREAAIIPRTSLKGTGMEVAVFSFGEGIMLGSRTDLHIFDAGSVNGPVIVTRFFFHMCVF